MASNSGVYSTVLFLVRHVFHISIGLTCSDLRVVPANRVLGSY